jgi:hypothetical protein
MVALLVFFSHMILQEVGIFKLLYSGLYALLKYSFYIRTCHLCLCVWACGVQLLFIQDSAHNIRGLWTKFLYDNSFRPSEDTLHFLLPHDMFSFHQKGHIPGWMMFMGAVSSVCLWENCRYPSSLRLLMYVCFILKYPTSCRLLHIFIKFLDTKHLWTPGKFIHLKLHLCEATSTCVHHMTLLQLRIVI